MSRYYENLHAEALQLVTTDTPLAAEPRTYFAPGTPEIVCSQTRVDFGAVMAAAEHHGKRPANLGAMAVVFDSQAQSLVGSGGLEPSPKIIQNTVHYPVINLEVVQGDRVDLRSANRVLRHEFAHVLQEIEGTPIYTRRWSAPGARALGAALLGADGLTTFGGIEDGLSRVPNVAVSSLAAGMGVFLLTMPSATLWLLTPRELEAHIFARRNREWFNPVSWGEEG